MRFPQTTNILFSTTIVAQLICLSLLVSNSFGQAEEVLASISWEEGPGTTDIGGIARIKLPAGFAYTGGNGAARFNELLENPVSEELVGILVPDEDQWYLTFEYSPIGYVPDDEQNALDADALLASIRQATDEGNAYRRSRGWAELRVTGWQEAPHYDPLTANLTWAVRAGNESENVVNYNVRLLGRRGVMSVTLVAAPEDLPSVLPKFKRLLSGYSFNAGQRHAEWRDGDRVASYGLSGLIAGGATVAAAKTGLLAKFAAMLAKGGKFLVVILVGIGAWLAKAFGGSRTAEK